MDAVSGVAAAVQLADLGFRSLFKIYSVVRDATEVPKRLKSTLSDIESFQNLVQRLQEETTRPNSKLALESTQTARLITTLETTASCSAALSQSLERILPPVSGSRLKRAWRALASIPKEDGILLECERLHRLKQDLQLELQLIGISLIGSKRESVEETGRGDEKTNVVELSETSIEGLAQSLRQMLISEHHLTEVLYSMSTVRADERRLAATRCCFQLIQYPSDLANAAETLETQQMDYKSHLPTSVLGPYKFCACQYEQSVSTSTPLGLFEAKSTSVTFHQPSCKVFARTRWKNEYSLRLSMKPFLDRTYELMLQSSSGAGGSSFSRTLRSFRTVNRLESPAVSRHIQKIARYFYSRGADLGAASTSITRTSVVKGGSQTFSFEVSSNPDMSIADLTYLALLNSFQTGAHITNVDDFIPIPFNLVSEIGSHIDSSFLTRVEYRGAQLTTKSGLLDLIVSNASANGVVDDIELSPLHHVILQRSMEKLLQQMKKKEHNDWPRRRSFPFDVAECAIGWDEGLVVLAEAGYDIQGALRMAVFRGDINTVNTLLSCDSDIGDTPLDCALCLQCQGSREVSRGHDRIHSLSQPRYRERDSQSQVMKLIVESLKARREHLYRFAKGRLPASIFHKLRLNDTRLDSDARRTEQAFKDCGIHVPYSLRPSRLPIYHTFNICCPHGGIELANLVYESGFIEVDSLDHQGQTPLLTIVKINRLSIGINWNEDDASAILWLLDHGADVDDPEIWKDTPLIHDVASLFDGVRVKQWNWSEDSSFLRLVRSYSDQAARETSVSRSRDRSESSVSYFSGSGGTESVYDAVQRPESRNHVEVPSKREQRDSSESGSDRNAPLVISSRVSTTESWASWETREDVVNPRLAKTLKLVHRKTRNFTDGCICFCSAKGCTPIHHIPVLYDRASTEGSVKSWATIEDDIFLWMELCDVPEAQGQWYIEEACRLEMFERLSMAHTCCRRPVRDETNQPATISNELRDELQKEDQESKEQLDFLMKEFKLHMESSTSRRLFSRWASWWARVDEILPPLSPWERGIRYCVTDSPMSDDVEQTLFKLSEERFGDRLEQAGYKGMDFIDVIEAHFEKHIEV